MRTRTAAPLLAALLVFMLSALPAAITGPKGNGKVTGKVQVEGVITAVNPVGSMFTMQATKRAAGTFVVLVQQATELKIKHKGGRDEDEDEDRNEAVHRGASIADFRTGDRVKVEAFRLDDGRLLALKIDVTSRVLPAQQPQPRPQGLIAQGVVTARNQNALAIIGADNVPRLVIVPSTTVVTGQRTSFAAIVPNDVVRVEGTVNADNSLTARQIEVVFASGFQLIGRITFKSSTPQFLVINNSQTVNVAGDTRIISGAVQRSFADLQVGQTVTVVGTPMTVAGVTVGVNARVITF